MSIREEDCSYSIRHRPIQKLIHNEKYGLEINFEFWFPGCLCKRCSKAEALFIEVVGRHNLVCGYLEAHPAQEKFYKGDQVGKLKYYDILRLAKEWQRTWK